jgi:hypothetical protein
MKLTERLEKVFRWDSEKIERLRRVMIRIKRRVEAEFTEGDKQEALQKMLNEYMKGLWGRHLVVLKEYTRKRRRQKQKKRAVTKQARKLKKWQDIEDMKERKIIRDREREDRAARGEQWSFRKFLSWYHETMKRPFIIHDEETFARMLEEDKNTHYFWGPRSARRKKNGRESFETRYREELVDPLVYALKRKARITDMIQQREMAIKARKAAQELAEKRAQRALAKERERQERIDYWAKVLGDWQREQNRLTELKRQFFMAKQDVYSQSRREFLEAMNEDVDLWAETPDECKYMRFVFGEGVKFPFNKTHYS